MISRKEFKEKFQLDQQPVSEKNRKSIDAAFKPHTERFSLAWLLAEITFVHAPLALVCLPFFVGGCAWWGRPCVMCTWSEYRFMARNVWSRPGLAARVRAIYLLTLAKHGLHSIARSVAWFVDELLYGRRLAAVQIKNPVFVVSAARSGSTKFAQLLECDERFLAPSMIQSYYPFLWLWTLASWLAKRGLAPSPERVQSMILKTMPPEYIRRHELAVFHADTLEVPGLLVPRGFFAMTFLLGADVWQRANPMAHWRDHPVLNSDLVRYIDRLGRKTLIQAPAVASTLYMKGHFLSVAEELAKRYPGARFASLRRNPSQRLTSMANHVLANTLLNPYIAVSPSDADLRALGEGCARVELGYDLEELRFFGDGTRPRRCLQDFTQFVHEPRAVVAGFYEQCMAEPAPPPEVLAALARRAEGHRQRGKKAYAINLTLPELGVAGDKLPKY